MRVEWVFVFLFCLTSWIKRTLPRYSMSEWLLAGVFFLLLFVLFIRFLHFMDDGQWWPRNKNTIQTTIDGTAWWSVSVCIAITADSHPHAESLILIRKEFQFFNFPLTHCVHCPPVLCATSCEVIWIPYLIHFKSWT